MEGPAQVLISTIDYNEYVGRIGIGRINRGTLKTGMMVVKTNKDTGAVSQPLRLTSLYTFDGLKRLPAEERFHGRHRSHERSWRTSPSAIRSAIPSMWKPCPSSPSPSPP